MLTSRSGTTLLELLIAICAGVIVMAAVVSLFSTSQSGLQGLTQQVEIQQIRAQLRRTINCPSTLATEDAFGGVVLHSRTAALVGAQVTGTGGVLDGSYHLQGPWYVVARDLGSGQGLEIRLARRSTSGWNAANSPGKPGQKDDFNAPFDPIIGGPGSVHRVCEAPTAPGYVLGGIYTTLGAMVASGYMDPSLLTTGCPGEVTQMLMFGHACANACKGSGYGTGWITGCQFEQFFYDANGNVTAILPFDPSQYGMMHIACSCVK